MDFQQGQEGRPKEGDAAGKRMKHSAGQQDWTSKLTDEVVVNVLSSLTLKEAVRTSVLSKRWMNLWKSSDLELDFDASGELVAIYDSLLKEDRNWFKNWVNSVVRQLQQYQQQEHNPTFRLKKFRVVFNFTDENNSEGVMDRWVEFAISNRVESLDLFLHEGYEWTGELYDFSDRFYNHIKTPTGLSDIKPLRSLRLSRVEVRREGLEHFIADCPLLEELSVEYAHLVNLRVVGSSQSPLRLKHFEVRWCWDLELLEIDHAPCLARLIHDGCHKLDDWRVGECPRLVEMVLGFVQLRNGNVFKALSGCTTRLEHLMVKTSLERKVFDEAVEHTRLERLTVEVHGPSNLCFLELVPLINVCPRLHTLRVVVETTKSLRRFRLQSSSVVKMRRESIKVVEIVGFRSDEMERELLEYVFQYFVGLERIVVDRSVGVPIPLEGFNFYVKNVKPCSKAEAVEAENLALRFKARAPPMLDFVVL